MKHIQPKTMLIYTAILGEKRFSQKGLYRKINQRRGVSIGLVNRVVNELLKKGFVEKRSKKDHLHNMDDDVSGGKYVLTDPLGLLRFISFFRQMEELEVYNISVNFPVEKVIEGLAERNVIFCLGTAQQMYTSYFRPGNVTFYSLRPAQDIEFLKSAPRGKTDIVLYYPDHLGPHRKMNASGNIIDETLDSLEELAGSIDTRRRKGIMVTSEVQTVIDMFCDGKGAYTKPLLRKLWGVEI